MKAFPRDDATKPAHLTAFMGYKAGMTHILRDVNKPGSKLHKKETVEAVTIVETPVRLLIVGILELLTVLPCLQPMVAVGIVGYVETPRGLRALTTVWANFLSEEVKRRFYRNWYRAKHKAFTKYQKKAADVPATVDAELARIKKYCSVVRVLAHTQIRRVKLGQKVTDLFFCRLGFFIPSSCRKRI